MRRQSVHLATDPAAALAVGMRRGTAVLLEGKPRRRRPRAMPFTAPLKAFGSQLRCSPNTFRPRPGGTSALLKRPHFQRNSAKNFRWLIHSSPFNPI